MSRNDAITFRPDFNAWWPDYDHAPEACFRFVQKGLPHMDQAIRLTPKRRVCVQAGAHAGFWPARLSGQFLKVVAFEPCPALHEACRRNLAHWGVPNVTLVQAGLGREIGEGTLERRASAGSSRCGTGKGDPIAMVSIDSLALRVDAIFLDIEGYEAEALAGAAWTIRQHRPIIHLEVLPRAKAGIEAHMDSIGYKLRGRAGNDAIYSA